MAELKEIFELEQAAVRDIRAQGGEVLVVPLKGDRYAPKYMEDLGQDLARFMTQFTGRGYELSRETMLAGDTRYVREPGYEAYGLKLFVDGPRILVGRVAVLVDETILRSYLKHLKRKLVEEQPRPRVVIDLPDDFEFKVDIPAPAEPEPDQPEPQVPAVADSPGQ
jgi:hypothetical protein